MEWVQVSVAMSLDGHIDDRSDARLILSGPEDAYAVHALRAAADAILVGAGTVRRDDPQLTVRYPDLLAARLRQGLPPAPMKVALTESGDLPPDAAVFANGGEKLVLCPAEAAAGVRDRLGARATVIGLPDCRPSTIIAALEARGVERLFVEGGSRVLTQFLASGCFHRLRLAVAPFFVGDPAAPRLVGPAAFRHGKDSRLEVERTEVLGDVAVIHLVNRRFGAQEG